MKELSGYKAIVTGGSDGIGFGIATALAQNGADLWLIARDKIKLQKNCDYLSSYGVKVFSTSADLSDVRILKTVVKEIRSVWNSIDILVNNVGIAIFTPFEEVGSEELNLQLDLNVRVPYLLSQNLMAELIVSKGCIINISSYFAERMLPGKPSTAYSLTKGALNSFTKALAFELGQKQVRVNAIAPGTVNTPLFKQNVSDVLSDEQKAEYKNLIKTIYPLGHIGNPEDIGDIAVFLASQKAKWITGAIFNVDGGLTTN